MNFKSTLFIPHFLTSPNLEVDAHYLNYKRLIYSFFDVVRYSKTSGGGGQPDKTAKPFNDNADDYYDNDS